MKRIILFSTPSEANVNQLAKALFPKELTNKTLAYMPSNGSHSEQIYTDYWKRITSANSTAFTFVDNLLPPESGEAKKIENANILLITGGNTFELLNNLRKSELDQAIKQFATKKEFVLGGFSAGAIVLSPTIATTVDENSVGTSDLTGLNIIDFEIVPHYSEITDKNTVEEYRKQTENKVREITDEEVIILDL